MSRNATEGRYAGKFVKIPWNMQQLKRECRTGPGSKPVAFSLKEWGEVVKEINSKRGKQ